MNKWIEKILPEHNINSFTLGLCILTLTQYINFRIDVNFYLYSAAYFSIFLGIFFEKIRTHYLYWIFLPVILIIADYYYMSAWANHQGLTFYIMIGVAIILKFYKNNTLETFQKIILSLLAGIMFFAVVNKLTSSSFIDGSYLYKRWLTGDLLLKNKLLLKLTPNWEEITKYNDYIKETIYVSFVEHKPIYFKELPPLNINHFLALSWLGIIIEIILPLLYFFSKKGIKHFTYVLFIITISFMTPEWSFMGLNSWFGLVLCKKEEKKWQLVFYILMLVYLVLRINKYSK